jgi:hypothetical protein
MGETYSWDKVNSLTFDSNGFSNDQKAAIWKMKMNRYGAVPITTPANNVLIATTER